LRRANLPAPNRITWKQTKRKANAFDGKNETICNEFSLHNQPIGLRLKSMDEPACLARHVTKQSGQRRSAVVIITVCVGTPVQNTNHRRQYCEKRLKSLNLFLVSCLGDMTM
jgi:hypothetical protein